MLIFNKTEKCKKKGCILKYDMVFRIEVDAFPIVFYNETDYIVQENQKKIFCCFGEKGN